MSKMTKRKLAIFVIALFLVGSLLIASNMGFKLVYQLLTSGAGSKTGTNWMAIPMNFPFANAQELKADIPNCTSVARHVRSDDTLQSYTGARGSVNFPIEAGLGYMVKVSVDTNYVIVGSHDPSAGISLLATGASSKTGTNWTSIPYHTTAGNAQELKADIPNCTSVARHVESDDTLQSYTGARGSVNFPITPGQGIMIKVSTDTSWTPSHY